MTPKAYAHEIIDTLSEFYRDMFLGWNRKMLRAAWTEMTTQDRIKLLTIVAKSSIFAIVLCKKSENEDG